MEASATADKTNNNADQCEVEADSVRTQPMDDHNKSGDIEHDIKCLGASKETSPDSKPSEPSTETAPVYGAIEGGKLAQEYLIEERDKGLFVIICNTEFNYTYNNTDLRGHKMDYTEDINRIRKTFNLLGKQDNLLIGKELTRTDVYGTKDTVFDRFMTEVVLQERKVKPKFLMFFLLSHGYENAEFLLAENKSSNERPCCDGKHENEHSKRGNCYARDIVKDVIGSVQKSPTFSDVPKIFVVQTCRGIQDKVAKKAKGVEPSPQQITPDDPDRYRPRGSDTLVLYSCIEAHKSWIKDTAGPFLVRNLCEAMDSVYKNVRESIQKVSDLHESLATVQADQSMTARMKALNEYREKKEWANLLFCPETFTDGWLTSVCQKTMADIATFLEKTKESSEYIGFPSLYAVEQRPEVSSTLRYKLSMIKVLRTQREKLYKDSNIEEMESN